MLRDYPTKSVPKGEILKCPVACCGDKDFKDFGFTQNRSLNRLIEAYLYINDIEDKSTKASCLARLLSFLKIIDSEFELKDEHGLHESTKKDLLSNCQELLIYTAEHYLIFKNIIKALSKEYPLIAFDICTELNTEFRRNRCFVEIIKSNIQSPIEKIDFQIIKRCLEKISEKTLFDDCLYKIIQRIFFEETFSEELSKIALQFIEYIDEVNDLEIKCRIYCVIYPKTENIVFKNLKKENILSKVKEFWSIYDKGWQQIDLGFELSSLLAKHNPDFSIELMQETNELRKSIILSTRNSEFTY